MTIGFTQEQAEYLDTLVSDKKAESIANAIRKFVEDGIRLKNDLARREK